MLSSNHWTAREIPFMLLLLIAIQVDEVVSHFDFDFNFLMMHFSLVLNIFSYAYGLFVSGLLKCIFMFLPFYTC